MPLTLHELKTDPLGACANYGLLVDQNDLYLEDQGGPCRLELTHVCDNVYRMAPKPGTGDWFFPYRPEIGFCVVPIEQPVGTIVFTGGMNGCTFAVYRHGGNYVFYHDNNGNYLEDLNPPGERICRIPGKEEAGSYNGAWDSGYTNAREGTNHDEMAYPQFDLFAVKLPDRWEVYASGILRFQRRIDGRPTGRFSMFRPHVSNLITSFGHD